VSKIVVHENGKNFILQVHPEMAWLFMWFVPVFARIIFPLDIFVKSGCLVIFASSEFFVGVVWPKW
jgi:hypothetical protein